MFNKITCKKCREKVNKNHSFCPNCGNYLSPYKKPRERKDDWGMLGKEDETNINEFNPLSNSIFGGLGEGIINKMLTNTMKILEKEMQKSMKDAEKMSKNPHTRFELYINGKKINPENIKITHIPIKHEKKEIHSNKKNNKILNKFFSAEETKRFAQLPIKEPKTNLRRLSDKIIYEISVPGVKSIENISVVKMDRSIEVKAMSKENSYFKTIPIDLNISNYGISNETIILELKE